jgi:hypothetical protein
VSPTKISLDLHELAPGSPGSFAEIRGKPFLKTNDPPILAARIFSSPGQQESFSFRVLFFFTAFLPLGDKKSSNPNNFFFTK